VLLAMTALHCASELFLFLIRATKAFFKPFHRIMAQQTAPQFLAHEPAWVRLLYAINSYNPLRGAYKYSELYEEQAMVRYHRWLRIEYGSKCGLLVFSCAVSVPLACFIEWGYNRGIYMNPHGSNLTIMAPRMAVIVSSELLVNWIIQRCYFKWYKVPYLEEWVKFCQLPVHFVWVTLYLMTMPVPNISVLQVSQVANVCNVTA